MAEAVTDGLPVRVAQYADALDHRLPGLSESALLNMAAILSGLQAFHGVDGRKLLERLVYYVHFMAEKGVPWASEALPRIEGISNTA
ncbi:hypothetical protein [Streptomyces sp. 5-10]|uniref:hypothetical protein n=1 Tax=Streptomyces sp. 5-10 TaxID=878925 RepID=UPI00168B0035|nr:hypothetical protein [Streptomyces sp. 5-10]MBD3004783.1 hypothetical protein [Streptomyces sp. 5-10]